MLGAGIGAVQYCTVQSPQCRAMESVRSLTVDTVLFRTVVVDTAHCYQYHVSTVSHESGGR